MSPNLFLLSILKSHPYVLSSHHFSLGSLQQLLNWTSCYLTFNFQLSPTPILTLPYSTFSSFLVFITSYYNNCVTNLITVFIGILSISLH